MNVLPSFLKETPYGTLVSIKVLPRASQSIVVGPEGRFLKIKLHSAPVEGNANEEMLELLHKLFRIPKKNIKILHGEKSRFKIVGIQGLNLTQVLAAVSRPHKS